MISLVPLTHIDTVWHHIAEGMKKACSRGGDLTPDWLFLACRKGDALLFVVHENEQIKAGLVCRVENWTNRRVLNVLTCSGRDMKEWLPEILQYRDWLKHLDIKSITFGGPKAYQRIIPAARVAQVIYEVDINGEV